MKKYGVLKKTHNFNKKKYGGFMYRFLFLLLLLCSPFLFVRSIHSVDVHEHGYFVGEDACSEHIFDPGLATALVDFFQREKATCIADFGCGMGDYVKNFLGNGLYCEGYDGNPDTTLLSNGIAHVLDLSQPIIFEKPFDWILSLEVGEHIPKEFEKAFIENMHNNNLKGIVLSWAVIGQGGLGHVNCQDNDYIKSVMAQYGYRNDVRAEKAMRLRSTISWFKKTIMVFRKI